MGSTGDLPETRRKPRFLCLHGFRTSGEIMRAQLAAKWPDQILSRLDLFFPDAPFPAAGKSEVDGIFPPPYYEWYQYDKDFMVYSNLDKAFARVEELMIEHGPFDGLMGFSQGAILSVALAGLQCKGLALTTVPKVRWLVIMGGAMFKAPEVAERVYPSKIDCASLHFIGEKDFLRRNGEKLLEWFDDPVVIRHAKGHTVPRLDEDESIERVAEFLRKIEDELAPGDAKIPINASEEETCAS
ncbi:esterase CBG03338-like [Zingiber officinale]|uniref:Serine hydrolase domain-containing protein n=1 Tax=Zingiber officinale TaxID=94328 RepID=A0A8J5CGW8_ZINOF|nr:esterase CBG03338-like [Zingiber officinale]KAG6474426.1 hypothetical protein ZIOFF_068361 [Zingiber officinale]